MNTTEYLNRSNRNTFKRLDKEDRIIEKRRIVIDEEFNKEEYLINKFYTIADIKNNNIVIR